MFSCATCACVRALSDIDSDGKLTCDEFVLAMHLIDVVRQGQALPAKLTPDLVPPSFRKGQKVTSHAVGLPPGGIGGVSTMPGKHARTCTGTYKPVHVMYLVSRPKC